MPAADERVTHVLHGAFSVGSQLFEICELHEVCRKCCLSVVNDLRYHEKTW